MFDLVLHGQREKASIEKKKSNDADKGFAIFEIDLGAGRDERRYDSRIDNVIEHGEITPVRSEKWFHARKFVGSTRSTSLRSSSALALPKSVQERFERRVGCGAER